MKSFFRSIGVGGFVIALAAPVAAQPADKALTKDQLEALASDASSLLRFRQLGDTATLGKGNVDIGVYFTSTPSTDSRDRFLGGSAAIPRLVARFGVSDRVDIGAWGGYDSRANYGMAGIDAKIALLAQGPGRPVSIAIRPSLTSLVGPSEVWAGTTGVDLTVSHAFGAIAPYAGLAASTTLAVERSDRVALDPVNVGDSLSYAGVSYRWRALTVSAEVEKASEVSYAFRVGTRF